MWRKVCLNQCGQVVHYSLLNLTNLTVLLELDECALKVLRLLSHAVCKSLDLKRAFSTPIATWRKLVYYSNIIATKYDK